jgi:peptidoglycan DL-endopeptidase CwlO
VAIRFAHRVRPLIAVAVITTAAITAGPTLAGATPRNEPSIVSVQKRLGELALKNTQLVEKYNRARVLVQRREKEAGAAEAQARSAESKYRAAHQKFAVIIQAQYESGGFGAAGALLDSSSDSNYIDRLETLNVASKHMSELVQDVTNTRNAARAASDKAAKLLASAKKQRSAVVQARKDTAKQIKKYQTLLNTLNARQQAAFQHSMNPSISSTHWQHLTKASSAAAQRAVQFALHQVGKPYVFGAAGPGAYDCSGLTMAAWQHGGVSLPHSAADQYNYGHHVSQDSLQPGDLIFFYQPIGHVTIYIGDGMMVSAPTEGEDVMVVPLSNFENDYAGATRLVG